MTYNKELSIIRKEASQILQSMPSNSRAKVCILVQNQEQHFLLLKRKPDEIYPNIWECPGGKLDDGETLEECVKRELEEETGITGIQNFNYLYASKFYENFSKKWVYVFYYKILTNQEPTSTPEHTTSGWFDREEGAELIPFEAPRYAILNSS